MNEQRNFLLAIVLSMGVLALYWTFIAKPSSEKARLEAERVRLEQQDPNTPVVITESALLSREDALASTTRVPLENSSVKGSLSLEGSRLDDLSLKRYRQTVDPESPLVTLLSPQGTKGAFYMLEGWAAAPGTGPRNLPGPKTQWRLIDGDVLKPGKPITLDYDNGAGLVFSRTYQLDDNYLFTITDTVTNTSDTPQTLSRYGLVRRHGVPEQATNNMILHAGPLAVVDGQLHERKYNKFKKDSLWQAEGQAGGWVGNTSKYWLAVVAPPQDQPFKAEYKWIKGADTYDSSYLLNSITLEPGGTSETTSYMFAGAKENDLLEAYQKDPGLTRLDLSIDWGIFWFLTKPFFWALDFFGKWAGNFGIAILLLTFVIKLIFFPLSNKSYEMSSKMQRLQPKMKVLQERYKEDRVKLQQEIMALYKREKVNPIGGCLPMLLQIPVFFALYKTLFITIEMRHAPFFGWIKDLSAPDPTSVFNLFGLIPWDPTVVPLIGATLLSIGAWPLIMGLTMALQQAMNPPASDPMQRRIFALMPIIFTVILAPFAAGLVIYWAWNNFLSILQQWIIYKRQGTETPIDRFFKRLFGKKADQKPEKDNSNT